MRPDLISDKHTADGGGLPVSGDPRPGHHTHHLPARAQQVCRLLHLFSVDINRMFAIFRIARALSKVKEMADYLKTKFPGTDKEREKDNFVFQHAKNILIASFQRILYNEYLPKVLGDKYMTDYQLKTPESSHSEYDQYSNAMMLHEFVTFAYRW